MHLNLLKAVFAAPIPVFIAVPLIIPHLSPNFLANDKKTVIWLKWMSHLHWPVPVIRVIFTLSSISSSLLFWSVNYTSMDQHDALVVFIIFNEWGAIATKLFIKHNSK